MKTDFVDEFKIHVFIGWVLNRGTQYAETFEKRTGRSAAFMVRVDGDDLVARIAIGPKSPGPRDEPHFAADSKTPLKHIAAIEDGLESTINAIRQRMKLTIHAIESQVNQRFAAELVVEGE